ncbi:hypothetical protein HPB50_028107 [Hyalomma asiaticum]|nr:hypothetical protein HPB50_028107 [Hyalomma asiaticum]
MLGLNPLRPSMCYGNQEMRWSPVQRGLFRLARTIRAASDETVPAEKQPFSSLNRLSLMNTICARKVLVVQAMVKVVKRCQSIDMCRAGSALAMCAARRQQTHSVPVHGSRHDYAEWSSTKSGDDSTTVEIRRLTVAMLDMKIKKLSRGTKQNDAYLLRDVLLVVAIRIDFRRTHSTQSADASRLLQPTRTTRETFFHYSDDEMTPSEARCLHESKLCVQDDGLTMLASGALNPQQRAVCYWHSIWRAGCLGGGSIDPLTKLQEKDAICAT